MGHFLQNLEIWILKTQKSSAVSYLEILSSLNFFTV